LNHFSPGETDDRQVADMVRSALIFSIVPAQMVYPAEEFWPDLKERVERVGFIEV